MAVAVRWLLLVLVVAGCTPLQTPPIERIALLAPFEGQFREIGYQALYSVRMAIAETGDIQIELLAIDDGGTVQSAADRVAAINHDNLITTVLALGPFATDTANLDLFDDRLRVVQIGEWTDDFQMMVEVNGATTCADICQLTIFAALSDNPQQVTVMTQAPPIDNEFETRYADFDTFAPTPLPIARLTYEVVQQVLAGDAISIETTYIYTYTEDGSLEPATP